MKLRNDNYTNEQSTRPDSCYAELLDFGNVAPEYSRAEAFADGFLIDVSELASKAGFRYPVAITADAWEWTVRVRDAKTRRDEFNRLWTLLHTLRRAITSQRWRGLPGAVDEIGFTVDVFKADRSWVEIDLKAVCTSGEEPFLTILLPEEE